MVAAPLILRNDNRAACGNRIENGKDHHIERTYKADCGDRFLTRRTNHGGSHHTDKIDEKLIEHNRNEHRKNFPICKLTAAKLLCKKTVNLRPFVHKCDMAGKIQVQTHKTTLFIPRKKRRGRRFSRRAARRNDESLRFL